MSAVETVEQRNMLQDFEPPVLTTVFLKKRPADDAVDEPKSKRVNIDDTVGAETEVPIVLIDVPHEVGFCKMSGSAGNECSAQPMDICPQVSDISNLLTPVEQYPGNGNITDSNTSNLHISSEQLPETRSKNIGLHCIGILPSYGSYSDSSDSDRSSSDSDEETVSRVAVEHKIRSALKLAKAPSGKKLSSSVALAKAIAKRLGQGK